MGTNETSKPVCPKCGAALPANAPAGLCPRCLMAMNLATQTVLPEEQAGAPGKPAAPPPAPAEIAPNFPQLEILECLGRGGMGVVYKARQKSLDRFVALKLLAPERVGDPQFAERFTREAKALAALNHPNIVTIHDFGQAGGFYYLLMEFVDGVNLRQALKAGRFTPEQALAIVPPLCDALQFAHERGIVHRDIKPENLLLDRDGHIKIADFGIAKMLGAPLTPSLAPTDGEKLPAGRVGDNELTGESAAGTPGYMAPEQKATPQKVDSRADIYSLGVVFYEMLTGELPGEKLQPPSRKVQIDVRLDEVVLRALEQTPELRYQTAAELRTQVETIALTPGSSQRKEAQADSVSELEHNPYAVRWPSWMSVTTVRNGRPVVRWAGVLICLAFLCAGYGVLFVAINVLLGNGRSVSNWVHLPGLAILASYLVWRINRNIELLQNRLRSSPGQSHKSPAAGRQDGLKTPPPLASTPADTVVMGKAEREMPWKRLALTVGFHAGLWIVLIGSLSFFIPRLLEPMQDLQLALPTHTAVSLGFVRFLQGFWFLLIPLLLGLDFAICAMLEHLGKRRWRRVWSAAVISLSFLVALGLLVSAGGSAWLSRGKLAAIGEELSKSALTNPPRVVRTEETLRREITRKLAEAGWQVEGLFVSVSPDLKRAECRFGKVLKGGFQYVPFNASLRLKAQGAGLWLVEGGGEFRDVRFSVDAGREATAEPGDLLDQMLTEFPQGVWNKPLSHYARNRRPDGWFALFNFPPAEDTWVEPVKLGLAADATIEQIAAAAKGGDLFAPDLDHLVAIRGTKLAPLPVRKLPDWPPPQDQRTMRQALAGLTRAGIVAAIQAYHSAHTNNPWVRLEEGGRYGALRPNGELLLITAFGSGDDKSVQMIPVGNVTVTPSTTGLNTVTPAVELGSSDPAQAIQPGGVSGDKDIVAGLAATNKTTGGIVLLVWLGALVLLIGGGWWLWRAAPSQRRLSPASQASPPRNAKAKWTYARFATTLLSVVIPTLIWSQRYEQVGLAAREISPDGRYSAMGTARSASGPFTGDRIYYKFMVGKQSGGLLHEWKVMFPKNGGPLTNAQGQVVGLCDFSKDGRIEWAKDSSSVRFFVHKIEVAAYSIPGGAAQAANSTATRSAGLAIRRVVVKGDKALVEGQVDRDGVIECGLQGVGLQLVNMVDAGSDFTAEVGYTVKRGLSLGTKRTGTGVSLSGTISNRELAPSHPFVEGRVVFRQGARPLEPNGSYLVADFHPKEGPPVPVFVHLRAANQPSPSAPEAPADLLPQSPQIRFLAWQDENPGWNDWAAWTWKAWQPDGAKVETAGDQSLLRHLIPTRVDLSGVKHGSEARILFLWLSHPQFDAQSMCELELTRPEGQPVPLFSGGRGYSFVGPVPDVGDHGWFKCSLAPDHGTTLPAEVNVALEYSLGPWKDGGQFSIRTKGTVGLPTGHISSVEETSDGRTLVNLVRDATKSPGVQFGFRAETKDGRLLSARRISADGLPTMRSERFEFAVPRGDLKEVRVQTRPIQKVEYRNVSARLEHQTKPAIRALPTTEVASAPPAFGPITLTNGVSVEVVAVCRNPRQSPVWWKPDGTLLAQPPVEIVKLHPPHRGSTVPPENEFLVCLRWKQPTASGVWQQRLRWQPAQDEPRTPVTVRDRETSEAYSTPMICFKQPPSKVDLQVNAALAAWEEVAVFDGQRTRSPLDTMTCSVPTKEGDSLWFDITHDHDRTQFALRMKARLKDGREVEGEIRDEGGTGAIQGRARLFPAADVRIRLRTNALVAGRNARHRAGTHCDR